MSLSNIIKGGRIRNQGYLDLSQRHASEMGMVYDELSQENEIDEMLTEDGIVDVREEKLAQIEKEIQERLAEANQQAEAIIAEAISRRQAIEKETQDKQ